MMDRPWFTHKDFTSLEIRKYGSLADHTVIKAAKITDVAYVNKLVSRIEQIPTNGDMMISFSGGAEHITLLFYSGDQVQVVEIIQKGFKTPSTGFNIKNEFERDLYAEIDAVLFPAMDKIVPKVKDIELDFGGFSLEYKGKRFLDMAPATLSFNIDEFTFKYKNGNTQLIEISAGQLPPKPFEIRAGGLEIRILTYHSKEEKRLYPDYFQVVG